MVTLKTIWKESGPKFKLLDWYGVLLLVLYYPFVIHVLANSNADGLNMVGIILQSSAFLLTMMTTGLMLLVTSSSAMVNAALYLSNQIYCFVLQFIVAAATWFVVCILALTYSFYSNTWILGGIIICYVHGLFQAMSLVMSLSKYGITSAKVSADKIVPHQEEKSVSPINKVRG